MPPSSFIACKPARPSKSPCRAGPSPYWRLWRPGMLGSGWPPRATWRWPSVPATRCPSPCRGVLAHGSCQRSWRTCAAMSGDRATYLDSPALVELIVAEPETRALRAYLRGRQRLASSALACVEVARAVAGGGSAMLAKTHELFRQVAVLRIGDGVLHTTGSLPPAALCSLDAIHLATASLLHSALGAVVEAQGRCKRPSPRSCTRRGPAPRVIHGTLSASPVEEGAHADRLVRGRPRRVLPLPHGHQGGTVSHPQGGGRFRRRFVCHATASLRGPLIPLRWSKAREHHAHSPSGNAPNHQTANQRP